MPIRVPDIAGAYIGGRRARQDEDYRGTRNALAEMEAQQAPIDYANRNRLADMQAQRFTAEQAREKLTQGLAAAQHIAQHPQAKAFAAGQFPEFVRMAEARTGKAWDALSDQEVQAFAGDVASQAAAKLGMSPAAPAAPLSSQGKIGADVRSGYLTPEQGATALNPGMTPYQKERLDIERQKLNQKPAGAQFVPLTPAEIQAAGLPAGTSAQRDTQTGKIDVLSKRDTSATLSQKDAVTAKNKLTTVRVARKQLDDIKKSFAAIQNTLSAGPLGQGKAPTEAGKKFDAAVGRMRSTLTALTRVPGVGAMSDYETKLDQQKFPDRSNYESVTADQIQGVDDLISILERGYSDLLSGGAGQAEQPDAQAPSQTAAPAPQDRKSLGGKTYVKIDGKWYEE